MSTRLTKELSLRRLQKKAQRWGGSIVKISSTEFHDLLESGQVSQAPFTGWDLGTDYAAKVVYYSPFCEPGKVEEFTAGLIHELGHTFASTTPPEKSDEFKFLGWEIALARRIGLTDELFCRQDYGLGMAADLPVEMLDIIDPQRDEDDEFQFWNLNDFQDDPAKRGRILKALVQMSRDHGLIRYGHPINVRE